MDMNYDKLAQEFGLEADEIQERIEDEGKTVLTLGWDADRPGGSGAHNVIEWNGYYFFTSTDMDSEGPFKSLEEVLKLDYFSTSGTPNPEIYSDVLPFERLEQIALLIDEVRNQIFVINDKSYSWQGDSLQLKNE